MANTIISQEWKTAVHALNLSQPDASTCQSACIAMAVGDKDVLGVRRKLNRLPGAAIESCRLCLNGNLRGRIPIYPGHADPRSIP